MPRLKGGAWSLWEFTPSFLEGHGGRGQRGSKGEDGRCRERSDRGKGARQWQGGGRAVAGEWQGSGRGAHGKEDSLGHSRLAWLTWWASLPPCPPLPSPPHPPLPPSLPSPPLPFTSSPCRPHAPPLSSEEACGPLTWWARGRRPRAAWG